MRIELRLDPRRRQLWHLHLAERLAARPDGPLAIAWDAGGPAWPTGAALLLSLEGMLRPAPAGGALETVPEKAFAAFAPLPGAADLVVDLSGAGSADARPRLTLLCDGEAFEPGALAAVLDHRPPVFETMFTDADGSRILSRWQPAVEDPRNAAAALGMLCGRAASMVLHEVARLDAGVPAGIAASPPRRGAAGSSFAFLAEALSGKVAARLKRLAGTAPDWYTALRPGTASNGLPAIDPKSFTRLPDDGRRFYADPFLFETDGRTHLFVEEFPHATGKGILSAAEIDASGRVGTMRPVLETDCHLSYPQVFAHQGAVWMIPETSGRRTVELYRADPYPDRWTLDRVLLADVDLGDATVERIGDRWWMFAASRERWTSSWDALSIFHAPDLLGPWTAHDGNPVLVDLHAARPAGRMLETGGRWIRPVQDCDGGYGAALGFAAIDELTPERYRQTMIGRIAPSGADRGLHTYNRSAGFEVIDAFGPRPKS